MVVPCEGQYISKICLTPKPDGSQRLILNLKHFNQYVKTSHFKIEDHRTVVKLIRKDCFLATLDLKDAYLLLPVNKQYRKYLRFVFEGTLYEYNAMPFGLNFAPLIFTKLMKPILCFLREKGYISVLYLDDFLLFGETYQKCLENCTITIKILWSLGFVINFSKSKLIPCQQIQYLGFVYNSCSMSISIPTEKKVKILKLVKLFSSLKTCKIRNFARFIGNLISICPAIKYSYMYTKLFERTKCIALRNARGQYNSKMKLPKNLKHDCDWWIEKIPKALNFIKIDNYTIEIFSDASLTGWGIHCNGTKTHGFWSEQEKKLHINHLELLAALFGLKCFASNLFNCNVLCRIDNTTAISYINRMGSIQHTGLNNIARAIW